MKGVEAHGVLRSVSSSSLIGARAVAGADMPGNVIAPGVPARAVRMNHADSDQRASSEHANVAPSRLGTHIEE